MNIIQCYAPTNDSNDDIKDQFYERLQSVIEKCPRKDLTILMGDLNAKVRIDNTGYEDIMGRHGLGQRNENGERFANLCAFNTLVIGGTIFPHKRIHKATWISPDHTTENQIDHICINEKFRRTMEDVRTRRGADVASDHHLVVANLKLKLKKNWTSGQTALERFNTAFLRDTDKLNEFKIALNNRFQALQDLLKEEETSMEDNLKGTKEALTSTCQQVLGLKKYHHKEWISTETLDKIKERKNKKAAINNSRTQAEKFQAQAEYIEANKQVKRSIRADKKKYVEELATMAEKAAREGNMKQLHDTTKKLSGKYSKPQRSVKDKEGKPITEIQQQRNRWVEYFEKLLNRPAPTNPPDIEAHTDLPIEVNPTTKEEIRMAIRQIKNWKAAGPDNIQDEALNVDRRTLWKRLRHYGVSEKIFNIIRNSYDGLQCKVVHGGQLTDAFEVRTGVRQGCLLYPFLFLLVVDWIMKTSTSGGKHGIQWTAQNQLDDLDFADDLALLSHTHEQMQIKTASVAAVSASVGLSIHKGKTKVLKFKAENSNPITLLGETLEDVESFTYLGSIIDVYARYSTSIAWMPSATAFCGREQTNFQLKNKLGKDDGNG
ncbi:unnamed protein product [Schistosoma margrebowiei]|uniref:Uncharacterized protein n=1 Tax=Schistosoma margrebowiei TaxID=48269 RepID=A0A183MX41_9TREM|nr:unnamed protein product [Schistosoma margrebowiei]